jgi:hypothetical protein
LAAAAAERNASRPSRRTKVSGSSSGGRKRKLTALPSARTGRDTSRARHAALRPALSPSKQNTTLSARRISLARWFGVVEVPSVATAFSTPCWASATTSM